MRTQEVLQNQTKWVFCSHGRKCFTVGICMAIIPLLYMYDLFVLIYSFCISGRLRLQNNSSVRLLGSIIISHRVNMELGVEKLHLVFIRF